MKDVFVGWENIEEISRDNLGSVYKIKSNSATGEEVYSCYRVISVPSSPAEYDRYLSDGMGKDTADSIVDDKVKKIISDIQEVVKIKDESTLLGIDEYKVESRDDGKGKNIFVRFPLLPSLPVYFSQRNITEKEAVKMGIDICQALEKMEKRGIVHGDIKLQNIYVLEDKTSDEVSFKLGDCGFSSAANKVNTYLAPEVCKGDKFDKRADIYSLGLIMYWFLNERRLPFLPLPPAAPTPSQIADSTKNRIAGEKIAPPKNGSDNLKEIVIKSLSFDASDRFGTPTVMKNALQKEYEALCVVSATSGGDSVIGKSTVGLNAADYVLNPDATIDVSKVSSKNNSSSIFEIDVDKTLKMDSAYNKEHSSPQAMRSDRAETNKSPDLHKKGNDVYTGGAVVKSSKSKKKMILIISLSILLLAGIAVAAMFLLGMFDGEKTSYVDDDESSEKTDVSVEADISSNVESGENVQSGVDGESQASDENISNSTAGSTDTSTEDASQSSEESFESNEFSSNDNEESLDGSEDTSESSEESSESSEESSESSDENHTHQYVWTDVKDATCTSNGRKEGVCEECGKTFIMIIPKTGHTYVDGKCTECGGKQ